MSFRDRCWYTLRCAHVTRAKRLAFPTRESAGAVRIGITFIVQSLHIATVQKGSAAWSAPD
jgi:hypothetical protein